MKDGDGPNDDNDNDDNNYNCEGDCNSPEDTEDDENSPLANVTPIWIALTVEISADPTFILYRFYHHLDY